MSSSGNEKGQLELSLAKCYMRLIMYEDALDWANSAIVSLGTHDYILSIRAKALAYLWRFDSSKKVIERIESPEIKQKLLTLNEALVQ